MNQSANDEGVCRTAPATPGLLTKTIYIKDHAIYVLVTGNLSSELRNALHVVQIYSYFTSSC